MQATVLLEPSDGWVYLYPLWSPGGEKLAYVAARRGRGNIWTVSMKDGAAERLPHQLTSHAGIDVLSVAWAPSGTHLYYHLKEAEVSSIQSVNCQHGGTEVTAYVPGGLAVHAGVFPSPDGRWLACTYVGPDEISRLFILDLMYGGSPQKLDLESCEGVAWSPGCGRFVISRPRPGDSYGGCGLYIVDAETREGRWLTTPGAAHDELAGGNAWTPSGDIVFVRGATDLMVIGENGEAERRLFSTEVRLPVKEE
jgi:Tol biopolymer transport system component